MHLEMIASLMVNTFDIKYVNKLKLTPNDFKMSIASKIPATCWMTSGMESEPYELAAADSSPVRESLLFKVSQTRCSVMR